MIRKASSRRIIVAAAETEILSLRGALFLVDTGDAELDASLAGYLSVATALGRRQVCPVSASRRTANGIARQAVKSAYWWPAARSEACRECRPRRSP